MVDDHDAIGHCVARISGKQTRHGVDATLTKRTLSMNPLFRAFACATFLLSALSTAVRSQTNGESGIAEVIEAEAFPPRVFFLDIGADAFTIRFMHRYHPPDDWAYLAFSERLNLAVFDAFEREGIKFSLPRRVTLTSLEGERLPIDIRTL